MTILGGLCSCWAVPVTATQNIFIYIFDFAFKFEFKYISNKIIILIHSIMANFLKTQH